MSKFKFELNRKGVGELLKSDEMRNILNSEAKKVQSKCGEGYEISEYTGKSRLNVSIKAKTAKARLDNNQNNVLLKAIKY